MAAHVPQTPAHSPPPALDGEKHAETVDDNQRGDGVIEETWNSSPTNMLRFGAVNLSFLLMGMQDASVGALIPYIEPFYGISHTVVSTLFIVSFVGYLMAALSNSWIHFHVGQRGIACLAPILHILGYVVMAIHPPFPALPIALLAASFGTGLEDSAYNTWVGNMKHANELLGILHGAYGLGGAVGPLIASAMVTKANLQWYTYFYLMIGMAVVELVLGLVAFRAATGAVYRQRLQFHSAAERKTTRAVLRTPLPWFIALFLFVYVGAEVSLGGWIPTFMLRVRHAEGFLAGLTATLFWLGLTLGRVVLGFVTGRIGEKLAIASYICLCVALELLYWLVPSMAASIVFVMLLGFFLGPSFPAAIVVATKLLPADSHVSAIGFAAAFGGGGAAIFPFAVGAIAERKGVAVLQPFVLGILVFMLLVWFILPGGMRKGGLEMAREEGPRIGGDAVRAKNWMRQKISRKSPRDEV